MSLYQWIFPFPSFNCEVVFQQYMMFMCSVDGHLECFQGFSSFILLLWWITFINFAVLNQFPIPLDHNILFFIYCWKLYFLCMACSWVFLFIQSGSLCFLHGGLFHLYLMHLLKWLDFSFSFCYLFSVLLFFICFSFPLFPACFRVNRVFFTIPF